MANRWGGNAAASACQGMMTRHCVVAREWYWWGLVGWGPSEQDERETLGRCLTWWGWCTSDIEWLYWESKKGLSSSVFFPVWWGLVLALGRDTLTSWPMVSYASRAALIASISEMGSQWMGAWMGLTCGSSSRSTGGWGSPDLERVRFSSWKWIPEFKSLV